MQLPQPTVTLNRTHFAATYKTKMTCLTGHGRQVPLPPVIPDPAVTTRLVPVLVSGFHISSSLLKEMITTTTVIMMMIWMMTMT